MVMGILILSNVLTAGSFFRNNELMRMTFGFILAIYGVFRGLSTYYKIKNLSRQDNDN